MAKLNTAGEDFPQSPSRLSALTLSRTAHARNAKARASQAANAGRISKAEARKIDKKADAVLKKG
jgi:hypothetical protein